MTTSPRRLAMATGAKTYQPDGPCRYGHVAPRYTSGKQCLACVAERRKPAAPPPDDALLATLTAHPGCTALELSVLLQRDDGDTLLALGSLQRLSLAKMRKGRWYAGRFGRSEDPARTQAVAEGRTTYNTGKPCKYGHLCDRFVSGNACVECNRLREAKRPPRVQRDRPRARPSGFALQNHWMR